MASEMTSKKLTLLLLLIIPIILNITYCDNIVTNSPEITEDYSEKVLRIGFSQIETDNPWRTAQINSFREATLVAGMELIYHEPEDYTSQWQIDDLYEMIEDGIDYLVIAPREVTPLISVLEAAKAADIPVILIDQNAEGIDKTLYISLISADYYKEGQLCAQMLAKEFNGKNCNIIEIYGSANSPMAQARSKGFHKELKNYPNMQIIVTEYGNFNRIIAQKAMENALIQAYNNGQTMNAVFAHSDEDGLGALQAMKAAGISAGEFSIVSINGVQDVCKAILAGEYLGTVKSNPRWGQIAVNLIQQIERGTDPFPVVIIPYSIINEENAYERFNTAY
jgi:ABC-type sugar transport system substrate-binding protein